MNGHISAPATPNPMLRLPLLGVCVAAAASIAAAQQAPSSPSASARQADATFEVATVKENKSGANDMMVSRPPGGRVNATNTPLRLLISYAYALGPQNDVTGGPGWINSARFDILAKLEGNPPAVAPGFGIDPARLAMRSLLADRFKLKIHEETREADVYDLVMAKPGGIPGPALKPSTQDCEGASRAARTNPLPQASVASCGILGGLGRLKFGGLPASQMAVALSGPAGREVVDRTGLAGSWEFELNYAPERGPGAAGSDAPAPGDAPSFFTAVQEQLGLKLESAKGSVRVLVIDSVEKPVED